MHKFSIDFPGKKETAANCFEVKQIPAESNIPGTK